MVDLSPSMRGPITAIVRRWIDGVANCSAADRITCNSSRTEPERLTHHPIGYPTSRRIGPPIRRLRLLLPFCFSATANSQFRVIRRVRMW